MFPLQYLCSTPCLPPAQTNIEITAETDFTRLLQLEEEFIQKMCSDIIALKPDLVFTEKGVSGRRSNPGLLSN